MTETDAERAARSLALEQAYVHEVYDQCADRTVQGKHWPRICEFIEELEPGALVCDIGCGNGKYLDVNHNVFKIGIDRCTKLTEIAREKDKEVLACDNLALPFRDESFDAVLSIAVVHHFSTTERRVRAIKELARVLRIGGRIVISVWAMEQKNRKFESQDVLVPWPRAYCISSTGSPIKPRGMSCDERHRGKNNAQTYLLSKRGNQRKGSKGKSYWIDPIFSPSPSTSSLSSPNETCYSFFRRALQKLAGGKRNSRAWFLENWQNGSNRHHFGDNEDVEDDDDEDVDSLPIELRRLEEGAIILSSGDKEQSQEPRPQLQQQLSDSLSVKSKSLSNIIEAQRQDLVRSRSSVPGLCSNSGSMEEEAAAKETLQNNAATDAAAATPPTSSKPRLVKQKMHFNDDSCLLLDVPENTAIQSLLSVDTPELQESLSTKRAMSNVHKQSSMNEELMSIERLKERESVRKNILKQASLNEELIYKSRPTFEAFRDTLYSSGARFQLLKSGLTNRIKQSTTNIEKVSGMSIKNGFVRILQSWTSTESPSTTTTSTTTSSNNSEQSRSQCSTPFSVRSGEVERRPSREDGSDSSKDSSLQSDTSVDSEDSFASVIFIPKKNSSPLIETMGSIPAGVNNPAVIGPLSPVGLSLHGFGTASAPPSPRVKYAPDLQGAHRLKLISMSPLVKQFPATSKSLPPPSPPGLSPRTLNSANLKPFFSGSETAHSSITASSSASLMERIAEVKRSFDVQPLPSIPNTRPSRDESSNDVAATLEPTNPFLDMLDQNNSQEVTATSPPKEKDLELSVETVYQSQPRVSLKTISGYRSMSTMTIEQDDETGSDDTSPLITDAIDEACEQLNEKPVITNTSPAPSKTSSAGTKPDAPTKCSDEDEKSRTSRLNQIKELLSQKPDFATRTRPAFPLVRRASTSATTGKVGKVLPRLMSLELFNPETDDLDSDSSGVSSPESVGSVISVISDERYKKAGSPPPCDPTDTGNGIEDKPGTEKVQSPSRPTILDKHVSPVESTWNEECRRHLINFTDRLSGESIINDIDQLCRRTKLELESSSDPTSARKTSNCKYNSGLNKRPTAPDFGVPDNNNKLDKDDGDEDVDGTSTKLIQRSGSEDSDNSSGFVVITNSGEFMTELELLQKHQQAKTPKIGQQRYVNNSIESSDIGDSIENTISESSQTTESRRLYCSGSTASLSSSESSRAARLQARSASEETPRRATHPRLSSHHHQSRSNGTLSGSSSQESLPSDQINYHQYYHVFREGELDQLIEKYVENLHIISSYYDHASWCVVAEKVQVWTI